MTETEITIEYLKIGVSILTPLTIILFGIIINRKLEKNKMQLLKEKEWQIIWASRFIETANELNDNISHLIITLFDFQNVKEGTDEYIEKYNLYMKYQNNIKITEWNIKNYTQFAEKNGQAVLGILKEILDGLGEIIKNRKGNIESIRQKQFDFNKAVRNAHAEIIKINTVHNIVYKSLGE